MSLTTEQVTDKLSLTTSDPVLNAFPEMVEKFIRKGYAELYDTASRHTERMEARLLLVKRIYVEDFKDGELKRAYSIQVKFYDYSKIPGYRNEQQTLPTFGVEYTTTIDSAGPDQMTVSFGQNENYINIEEAEDRFLRVFNGLGQPFYQG